MGGYGSGRRPTRNAGTVTDMRRLDVRKMKREGSLDDGRSGWWQWRMDGEVVASIGYQVLPGVLRLTYNVRDRNGRQESMDYRVVLEWTPCNYGGARVWFRCPSCDRRVAILYGGRVFACRQCQRLVYDCQRETPDDRACRQVDKLRERLKWEPGLLNGNGWKPKWMRWRTFNRLEARHDKQMYRVTVLMRQRFGRDVDAFF